MLTNSLAPRLLRIADRRPPDFIVGGADNPYLNRWWLVPRNRVLNVYLHQFMRDDDDRALHDHPWPWCSILLAGEYREHTIAAGGIHTREVRRPGSVKFALPSRAHRVELPLDLNGNAIPCWTLFITGPRVREWGFHCEKAGWIPWREFVDEKDIGKTGRGCGEHSAPNGEDRRG